LNYDGFIELQDLLDVVKSSLVSAIHIAEFCREEYEAENVDVHMKEFDFSIKVTSRPQPIHPLRTEVGNREKMVSTVFAAQWPHLKEFITKRFKEMDKGPNRGKVSFKEFTKVHFVKFPEVNQFITFYATILSNGPELRF
jgi:hypothetical protein